jgi:serine/threonine protein kinase/tetratricopeptide (TPR) repeat protein
MNGSQGNQNTAAHESMLERVDRICDAFEAAWQRGEKPRVEDYLGTAAEPERSKLLEELLKLELEFRGKTGDSPVPQEFLRRFPQHAALITVIFARESPSKPVENISSATGQLRADRNLLFGILALQMDFVNREQLIAGMNAWVLHKTRSLGEILLDQGALRADMHALLAALVEKHLEMHAHDPRQSLAALSSISSAADDLKNVPDEEVQASIRQVATVRQVDAETTLPGLPRSRDGMRFRVLRPHAKGGLGEVFIAQDRELRREVALKEIQEPFADEPEARSRFVREAEITGHLEHPGIVPVYGLGAYANGRPFYAMRFVKGDNLKEAIERFHATRYSDPAAYKLDLHQLLRRFLDVCNAVAYAHSRRVLHRDLKPGNILLGPYGETLVVDWGLAKPLGWRDDTSATQDVPVCPPSASSSAPTEMGAKVGTLEYMSPEQLAGHLDQLGPSSDVYSLGATLYYLLAGRAPFKREDKDIETKIERGDFPRPRAVRPDVPPALEAISLKAMALRQSERYPTPRALADDIDHWLADEPVSCYAEPLLVRGGRWARKHKPVVSTAAAAFFTATVGLAVGLYFVNAEKNRTELARQGEEDQRIAAQKSEEKARTEAATATAVKEFLQRDLFQLAAARKQYGQEATGVKMDPELKVRDLVLRAAQKIEGKFTEQPLVEAEIRSTLGWTLVEIGRADLAIPQLVRARELYTVELSADHPNTLESMMHLANSYDAAGRTRDALKLREETLQISKAKLGPDHPVTLKSMMGLAIAYDLAGRIQDALKLREETLKFMKAKFGLDHLDTLGSMNNLATSYYAAGRTQDALKLREETLQLSKAKLGPDHPDMLAGMLNLANSYDAVGRGRDALRLREETLQLMKAKLGADHPDSLRSMNNLACSYAAAGRAQDALKLHEETLQLRKAKLGSDHPDTLRSMNNLAVCYANAGRMQDALKLREETLQLSKAKLGPDHPGTLVSMDNLSHSYNDVGRTRDALKLREETLQLSKAKLGPDHPDTLRSMNDLAVSYIMTGQLSTALELLQQTLALRVRRLRAEPGNSVEQSYVAMTHGQLGDAEQAGQNYRAAAEAFARSVQMFDKLDKAGKLTDPFFGDCWNHCRQRLAFCRKAEQAVRDLDFTVTQPAAEVPPLLDIRVRFLLKERKLSVAVESAATMRQLAGEKPDHLYDAACLYGLCAGGTTSGADATQLAKECANEAMTLLKHAVAQGYKNAAHMKQDPDLAALRPRADFQKLLAELEGKK